MKNCSGDKRIIGKLVLEYEDEILNTTLLDNKKVTRKKIAFLFTRFHQQLYAYCYQLLFPLVTITITQEIDLKRNTYYHINIKLII